MKINAAPVFFPEQDRQEILQSIDGILSSGQLTLGQYGDTFEKEFTKLTKTEHAVAVNSGTSALEIILRTLNVKGKEVIVPTNTFFATAAAVLHAGGRVRFADIDPNTLCVDSQRIEAAFTADTAGAIVVHIGGIVTPDIENISALCQRRGIWLVEDAAHAHGSFYKDRAAGSFGVASAFSFYPTKVITSGEGGMIVTNDVRIRDEALVYRDQGKAGFTANVHTHLGYNWRLSEVHAVLGLSQLRRLREFISVRRKIAGVYDELLRNAAEVSPLFEPPGVQSNYYKYMVFLRTPVDRKQLKTILREKFGVPLAGEVYELPCHKQPVFGGSVNQALPDAEAACASHICLPMSARMTPEEAKYAATSLLEVLRSKRAAEN